MAQQLSFFDLPRDKAVNVASIKHRSPFRYPGGKEIKEIPLVVRAKGEQSKLGALS